MPVVSIKEPLKCTWKKDEFDLFEMLTELSVFWSWFFMSNKWIMKKKQIVTKYRPNKNIILQEITTNCLHGFWLNERTDKGLLLLCNLSLNIRLKMITLWHFGWSRTSEGGVVESTEICRWPKWCYVISTFTLRYNIKSI